MINLDLHWHAPCAMLQESQVKMSRVFSTCFFETSYSVLAGAKFAA